MHWYSFITLCGVFIQVEDFAERSQNCARAVREKEFDTIHQSFRDTISHLNLAMGSSSLILEIKHTLFGVKSLKRISEEPLVQPVEKHLKVSNEWTNSMFSNSAPFVGPHRHILNGYSVDGPYGIVHPGHHSLYSNHNQELNGISRQQGPPFQGSYQQYSGWAAGRGIISSVPGGQVSNFADSPGHDHMGSRIGSQPFQAQQIHHPQMGFPVYNAQAAVRSFNYTTGRDMGPGNGPGMLGPGNASMAGPLLYPPYQARPRPGTMYFPAPDARRVPVPQRQTSNWGYNQAPAQGDHASQAPVRRSNR